MLSQKRRYAKEKYRYFTERIARVREETEIENLINEIFAEVDTKVKILAQII